ncbi:MAG: DNA-binding protein [Pedosphaera sp.]|nr:DNA-binding protein [Pedosphaera sp.]
MPALQNIIGPVVRRIRYQRGWTQAMLTARCAQAGWDVHESTIGKIEAQYRCVTDREIVVLAQALGIKVQDLFPIDPKVKKSK